MSYKTINVHLFLYLACNSCFCNEKTYIVHKMCITNKLNYKVVVFAQRNNYINRSSGLDNITDDLLNEFKNAYSLKISKTRLSDSIEVMHKNIGIIVK